MAFKQVIVVRADLNMSRGKVPAQVAHAAMKIFLDRMKKISAGEFPYATQCDMCLFQFDCKTQDWERRTPEEDPYVHPNSIPCKAFETNVYKTFFNKAMIEWIDWEEGKEGFTKILARCDSEQELLALRDHADKVRLPNALILDNGHTEFKTRHCPVCDSEDIEVYHDPERKGTSMPERRYMCKSCKSSFEIEHAIKRNKPTYTCLAIGPDDEEKVNEVTGHLKLY